MLKSGKPPASAGGAVTTHPSPECCDNCELENSNLRKCLAWAGARLPLDDRRILVEMIKHPVTKGGVLEDGREDDRRDLIECEKLLRRMVDHIQKAVESSALDWVIVGGENGPDARPMHPQWARDIRDQCQAAGVPFFFKQFGEWAPGENGDWPPTRTERVADWFNGAWHYSELSPRVSAETHDEQLLYRLGKKAAGRLLDGVEHSDFPEIQA